MSQLGSTAGGLGGRALGNILLPGLGGIAGGLIGSRLGGLIGGRRKPAGTTGTTSRDRLKSLTASLNAKAAQPLTESAGYQAQIGAARDDAREGAQADAARAGVMGLAPGTAIAAGAGSRARALAGAQRGALLDAEAQQTRLQGLTASLLGQEAQMDENERARRAQGRNGMLGAVAGLAGTAVNGALQLRGGGRRAKPDTPDTKALLAKLSGR